ncbi:MAG: hypothetical protein KDK07_24505 [Bauldia sp.]|nr:hypothetical protein [Bauldia sp.]
MDTPITKVRTKRPNALNAELMSPVERIAEIGALLALGLVRLRARQSTSLSAATGESFVDCLPTPSGHGGTEPETAAR